MQPFRPRPRFGFRPRPDLGPRTNARIRVPQVFVIGSNGEQLGPMITDAARKLAEDEGLDLVEVSPTAKPPVCKIMDYGKFRYEKQKKEQQSKKRQVKVVVKEIKLRPNTNEHDVQTKMNHVRRFIAHKDKAKITIQFRGREMSHMEIARASMAKMIESLSDVAEPEAPPRVEGRTMSVIMMPGKKK